MPLFTPDTQETVEGVIGSLIGCRMLAFGGMALFLIIGAAFAMGGPACGIFLVIVLLAIVVYLVKVSLFGSS